VYVNLIMPAGQPQAVPEVADYARTLANDFRTKHPHIDLYLIGSVIIDQAFAEASQQDLMTLFPIAFVAVVSLVAIGLRSFMGLLPPSWSQCCPCSSPWA
jgi:predicted RND superfamily exporter protein